MRALLCLGLLLTWLLAGGVRAQSASADAEARALFEAGRVAFVDERYGDALASFQRSHDLSQRPELLYNIAACLDRLDREEEALRTFERFLAARPTAPEREDVERRMVILREHVARDSALAAARAEEEARAAEERARAAEAERALEVARVAEAERAAAEARAAADAERIAAAERAAEDARAHAAAVEAAAAARVAEAARLTEAAHRAVEAAAEGARAAAEAATAASAASALAAEAAAPPSESGPDGGAVAAVVTVLLLAAGGGVTAAVLLTQDPGYAPFSEGDVSAMTLLARF